MLKDCIAYFCKYDLEKNLFSDKNKINNNKNNNEDDDKSYWKPILAWFRKKKLWCT